MTEKAYARGEDTPALLTETIGATLARTVEAQPDNLARIDAELDALILRVMTRAEDEGMLHDDFSAADAAVFVSVTIGGLLHQWLRSGKTFPLAARGETLLRRHVAMLRGTDRDPPRAGPATEPA